MASGPVTPWRCATPAPRRVRASSQASPSDDHGSPARVITRQHPSVRSASASPMALPRRDSRRTSAPSATSGSGAASANGRSQARTRRSSARSGTTNAASLTIGNPPPNVASSQRRTASRSAGHGASTPTRRAAGRMRQIEDAGMQRQPRRTRPAGQRPSARPVDSDRPESECRWHADARESGDGGRYAASARRAPPPGRRRARLLHRVAGRRLARAGLAATGRPRLALARLVQRHVDHAVSRLRHAGDQRLVALLHLRDARRRATARGGRRRSARRRARRRCRDPDGARSTGASPSWAATRACTQAPAGQPGAGITGSPAGLSTTTTASSS